MTGRGRFEQAFAQEAAVPRPQMLEADDLVAGLAHGHEEKLSGGSGAKLYGGEPAKFARIEDGGASMRAGEHCSGMAGHAFLCRMGIRAELVFGEIDHEVRLAGGDDALQPEGQIHFVIMQRADEGQQRRRAGTRFEAGHGNKGTGAGSGKREAGSWELGSRKLGAGGWAATMGCYFRHVVEAPGWA